MALLILLLRHLQIRRGKGFGMPDSSIEFPTLLSVRVT
jgi:hypothetical protein